MNRYNYLPFDSNLTLFLAKNTDARDGIIIIGVFRLSLYKYHLRHLRLNVAKNVEQIALQILSSTITPNNTFIVITRAFCLAESIKLCHPGHTEVPCSVISRPAGLVGID